MGTVARAQEAFDRGDLDEVLDVLAGADESAAGAHLRASALTALRRFDEAEPAARRAVDLAFAERLDLAPAALTTLALVGQATGDPDAEEHLRLAEQLRAGSPPDAAQQENLARFALGADDLDLADRLFADAGARHLDAGRGLRAAHCLVGQASVAVRRTRLTRANRLLRKAATVLKAAGDDHALIECLTAQGNMLTSARLHAAADECYLAARALATRHEAWHEVARIDARRAQVALDSIGKLTRKATRTQRLQAALNLALPAALATDAVRHRFPPGAARERWVRSVAEPVLALSLRIVAELGWPDLAMELVENKAASVALDTSKSTVDTEVTLRSPYRLAEPAGPAEELPFAAAALVAGLHGGEAPSLIPAGFAVPPRVRTLPSGDSLLEPWLDAARERYHLDVRSADEVRAW